MADKGMALPSERAGNVPWTYFGKTEVGGARLAIKLVRTGRRISRGLRMEMVKGCTLID
jgi:hypothetical protein